MTWLGNLLLSDRLLGGRSPQEIEELRDRILQLLKSIGLKEDSIQKVAIADKKWVANDYSMGVLMRWLKSPSSSEQQRQIVTEILDKWNSANYRPTPDDLLEQIQQQKITDPIVLELAEDYKYYMAHGTHRRLDVWLDRRSWLR